MKIEAGREVSRERKIEAEARIRAAQKAFDRGIISQDEYFEVVAQIEAEAKN